LVDVRTGQFSTELAGDVGLSGLRFPPMAPPGTVAGHTTAEVSTRVGARSPVPVYRVAGHDTASAFACATGNGGPREALIASGTWSLVGLCLPHPITSEAARHGGFTNELGADGVLFLRNLSGMWVLQECLREWAQEDGAEPDLPDLLAQAAPIARRKRRSGTKTRSSATRTTGCFPPADCRSGWLPCGVRWAAHRRPPAPSGPAP